MLVLNLEKEMKKLLIILAFVFIFSATVFTQTEQIIITAIKANLRGTPNSQGVVVTTVNSGETFTLIKQVGEWYLVQTPKYVGWLHNSTARITTDDDIIVSESNEIKIDINYLEPLDDDGYDIVKLSAPTSLYSYPNASTATAYLPSSNLVVLLQRGHNKGWLNVLDVKTGTSGWIYYKTSKVYFTRKPKQGNNLFQATRSNSNEPPDITITNDTNRLLTVKLGENTYTIQPMTTSKITLSAGTYNFHAFVPNAYPMMGSQTFDTGYGYTWRFYIGTK